MKNRSWAVAIVFALAGIAQAAAPERWTLHDVGSFGSTGSDAWGLNNRGDVVGFSNKRWPGHIAEIFRCFVWQNGVLQDIGAPGDFCQALGVNDRGTIVAHTGYGDESWILKDGLWTRVGPGVPYAINKSDDIAGQYWSGSGWHAFMVKDGVFRDLGTLGRGNSSATAINDKGVVVGISELPQDGVAHAFVYENGLMRDLGTLGHEDSSAADINNHGVIVGFSANTLEDSVAFITDTSGRMRRLFDAGAGAGKSYATGINDRGAVVGALNDRGFLYEDGVLTMLDDIPRVKASGWSHLIPSAINDRGWIIGRGARPGGMGLSAFVLVPNTSGGSDFGSKKPLRFK
jgi:probable HAF family extracellular repeat protein